MTLKKPRRIRPGDRVAAVSLSWGGASIFPNRYDTGKKQLEETFGVTVVEMPHTLADAEFLDKNPAARADDLMQAFRDPTIDAIIVAVGGEDSIRLIPYLDYQVIADNPKVLLGCSDTTVTHLTCFRAGLTSFYGPMIFTGCAEETGMLSYTVNSMKQILSQDSVPDLIPQNNDGWTVERSDWSIRQDEAVKRKFSPNTGWRFIQGESAVRGHLLGGCMEVLEMLRGTEIWPTPEQWQGALLFIETSEEGPPPTILRRALRSYAAEGVLQKLNGMMFGRPGGQTDPSTFAEYDDVITQVVRDEQGLDALPIVTNMDFGHTEPIMTLPYGAIAELDPQAQEFRIVEASVTS